MQRPARMLVPEERLHWRLAGLREAAEVLPPRTLALPRSEIFAALGDTIARELAAGVALLKAALPDEAGTTADPADEQRVQTRTGFVHALFVLHQAHLEPRAIVTMANALDANNVRHRGFLHEVGLFSRYERSPHDLGRRLVDEVSAARSHIAERGVYAAAMQRVNLLESSAPRYYELHHALSAQLDELTRELPTFQRERALHELLATALSCRNAFYRASAAFYFERNITACNRSIVRAATRQLLSSVNDVAVFRELIAFALRPGLPSATAHAENHTVLRRLLGVIAHEPARAHVLALLTARLPESDPEYRIAHAELREFAKYLRDETLRVWSFGVLSGLNERTLPPGVHQHITEEIRATKNVAAVQRAFTQLCMTTVQGRHKVQLLTNTRLRRFASMFAHEPVRVAALLEVVGTRQSYSGDDYATFTEAGHGVRDPALAMNFAAHLLHRIPSEGFATTRQQLLSRLHELALQPCRIENTVYTLLERVRADSRDWHFSHVLECIDALPDGQARATALYQSAAHEIVRTSPAYTDAIVARMLAGSDQKSRYWLNVVIALDTPHLFPDEIRALATREVAQFHSVEAAREVVGNIARAIPHDAVYEARLAALCRVGQSIADIPTRTAVIHELAHALPLPQAFAEFARLENAAQRLPASMPAVNLQRALAHLRENAAARKRRRTEAEASDGEQSSE